MGWRDIIRAPDPSRALYEALRRNPTASRAADVFQGGFEGAMEGLGRLGHVAGIPARAVAGAATNAAGLGRPVDVSDYALYGRDLETGLQGVQYGDLLAGTMEDAGELAPGGTASKLLRLAGNAVTDPTMAPALLTGAEALGALGGPRAMAPAFQGRPAPPPLPPGAAPARPMPPGSVPPRMTPPPLPPGSAPPRPTLPGSKPLTGTQRAARNRARELGPRG